MIGFKKGEPFREVDPLNGGCSLDKLGALYEAEAPRFAEWCSEWGLVGSFCENYREPRIRRALEHYADWSLLRGLAGTSLGASPYGEPLALLREAANVARAASRLYWALDDENYTARVQKLRKLIEKGETKMLGGPDGFPDRQDSLFGVSIGSTEEDFPETPVEWNHRGWQGINYLVDTYFNQNLSLVFGDLGGRRRPQPYWRINSLMGILFFKLFTTWRGSRYCEICGARIDHRRLKAKTCGARCRKALSRRGLVR